LFFVCFFLYHSLMNKVAHHIATGQVPGEGKCSPFADPTTAHLSSVVKLVTTIKRRAFFFSGKRFATEKNPEKRTGVHHFAAASFAIFCRATRCR